MIFQSNLIKLILVTVLGSLIIAACSSEPLTVAEIEETRVARATEIAEANTEAIAERQANIESRAPEGAEVAPESPSAEHVSDLRIPWGEKPPWGGPHNPTWQQCDVYEQPIRPEHAIHSLEHGAVWISYQTDMSDDDVNTLRRYTNNRTFVLMSPYPEQASPVVLTAWGVQLEVDDVDDSRIEAFLNAYVLGPQTPEPGAACTGGTMSEDTES